MAGVTYSETLKGVMGRIIGERSYREVAEAAGCDHTLIFTMHKHGRVPRRATIAAIADGLGLPADGRTELFHAAGYLEIAPVAPAAEPALA
jgi:hypothetical protein